MRWTTAFLDLPADVFETTATFWAEVTASRRSVPRGATGQYATLLPPDGDAYLRVQRVDDGPAHLHLDLHVDDVDAFSARAVALGATEVRRGTPAEPLPYVTLASPGGLVWCAVPHRGEAVRPRPVRRPDGGTELVDQFTIDVPPAVYEREGAFWAALTGWEHRTGAVPGLSFLARPEGMPLRLLLQRLGDDDGGTVARAHLDLACGPDVATAAHAHAALGATPAWRGARWTTLRDPAGLAYCLTERNPTTGTLTA